MGAENRTTLRYPPGQGPPSSCRHSPRGHRRRHRHWREGGHRPPRDGCRHGLVAGSPPRNHSPARTPGSSWRAPRAAPEVASRFVRRTRPSCWSDGQAAAGHGLL